MIEPDREVGLRDHAALDARLDEREAALHGRMERLRALAAEAAAQGVRYVDAPLTLGPAEAEAGTLNVIVGADDVTHRTTTSHVPPRSA